MSKELVEILLAKGFQQLSDLEQLAEAVRKNQRGKYFLDNGINNAAFSFKHPTTGNPFTPDLLLAWVRKKGAHAHVLEVKAREIKRGLKYQDPAHLVGMNSRLGEIGITLRAVGVINSNGSYVYANARGRTVTGTYRPRHGRGK